MCRISNAEGGEQAAAKHSSGHTHETSCVALVKVEPPVPAPSALEPSAVHDSIYINRPLTRLGGNRG